MDLEARIQRETVVTTTPLVPELSLHLITHDCRLWHAREEDAAEAGLPEPYWAFAWPGGQALARHVLDHPHLVRGRRVLDFGSGSAVEGLAALLAGAASVTAADLDPVAAVAARLNARLNGIEQLETSTYDLLGTTPDAEVVLAGDVFYDRDLARLGKQWLETLHRRGRTVLIGDPSRGFLDLGGLVPVASYRAGADGDVTGREWKETGVWTFG
jgi:predicted nicotinamide N-methyase